jgi:hypothetical protein
MAYRTTVLLSFLGALLLTLSSLFLPWYYDL